LPRIFYRPLEVVKKARVLLVGNCGLLRRGEEKRRRREKRKGIFERLFGPIASFIIILGLVFGVIILLLIIYSVSGKKH